MAVPHCAAMLRHFLAPKWNSPASYMENRYEQTYDCTQANSKWQLHPLPSEPLASRRPKAAQPWLERQVGTALAMRGSLISLRVCEKYCIAYKHQ